MTGLGLSGLSLSFGPLPARVTRARNVHSGGLRPLRHKRRQKSTWAGQIPTAANTLRRRARLGCPPETPSFVAARCAARATLRPIRSRFSDEGLAGIAPENLREFGASKPARSPQTDFASDRDWSLKTGLGGRRLERFSFGRGRRVRQPGWALARCASGQHAGLSKRPTLGLCLPEILDGEGAFRPSENKRKFSGSQAACSPYAFISNARHEARHNFLRTKRSSESIFVHPSYKRCFSSYGTRIWPG